LPAESWTCPSIGLCDNVRTLRQLSPLSGRCQTDEKAASLTDF
jgi:hypothetical protein